MNFSLYADVLRMVNGVDPALGVMPPSIYCFTLRTRYEQQRKLLDA